MRAWARARGFAATPPKAADGGRRVALDMEVGTRVEHQLELARDALSALDAAAAEQALLAAERELRSHPELPHAAWLRAEVERGWAVRWARVDPIDRERAQRAWARAAALDGGRAPGIGEPGTSAGPPRVGVHLSGGEGDVAFWLDGAPLAVDPESGSAAMAPGEHALVIRDRADGTLRFADWIAIGEGSHVALPSFLPPPCTSGDFARTRRAGDGSVASDARCPTWIAAAPSSRRGQVTLALCHEARCAPAIAFAVDRPDAPDPGAPRTASERRGMPAWVPWTLAAVGTVALTSVGLYAAGAFDAPERQVRFVHGGVKTTSAR